MGESTDQGVFVGCAMVMGQVWYELVALGAFAEVHWGWGGKFGGSNGMQEFRGPDGGKLRGNYGREGKLRGRKFRPRGMRPCRG